jgi:CMP/dCMP kinase
MSRRVVVAIDGPAGAGKSTIARAVAARLGFVYIDTGAMYRAVGLWALRTGIALDEVHKLEELARHANIEFAPGGGAILLNGEDITAAIRERSVSDAASRVSAIPGVRRALVEAQQRISEGASVVMEGRDIGTVVFPNADVKIFLDAQCGTRAERRTLELRMKGEEVGAGAVQAEMVERDQRDRTRADSPLVQAPDAVYVDTTGLSVAEVEEAVLKIVRARVSNGKEVVR